MTIDAGYRNTLSGSISTQAKHYALKGHISVEGWLGIGAISTMLMLNEFHRSSGVSGSVCEIGVHHGRLFVLLALLRQESETGVAIDVFENQYLNVDFSGSGSRDMFWSNVDHCVGSRQNITTLGVDSLTLSSDDVLNATHHQLVRMFSVDGGHTARHLLNDVRLASKVLNPGGVVIVDDFYNADWPGVNEGVFRYLMESPILVPFCYGDNKLYLCHQDAYATMIDWTRSVLVPSSHYAKEVELCGVKVFHCHPPAPEEIFDPVPLL